MRSSAKSRVTARDLQIIKKLENPKMYMLKSLYIFDSLAIAVYVSECYENKDTIDYKSSRALNIVKYPVVLSLSYLNCVCVPLSSRLCPKMLD